MRSHYVCWERQGVFDVLNTEADEIDPAVFMAVHTDRPMTRYERHFGRRDETVRSWSVSADDFLDEFLAQGPTHIQAVILGGAGSGKSHFIKWLEFNLPRDGRYRVLSIPKMSVGLRDVIGRIINVLPEDQRAEYREHLDRSGFEVATREFQKHRLLAEIALAIRSLRPDTLQSEFLVQGLPLLFEDPDYKAALIAKPTSVLDDLVDHIVSTPTYERRTERRQFERDDLPLQGVNLAPLSDSTRTFMRQLLARDALVEPALRIVNRGVDAAIGNVLEFPDDRLLGLMRDVRRHLRSLGEALVLLVEDFAVMQGVDYALLQALTERASDTGDGLCELRWAMAMTTGYYEVLPDTFKDRMDLVVGMDLRALGAHDRADGAVGLTSNQIVEFAARYLRASRLPAVDLGTWYGQSRDEAPVPPSRCAGCEFRPECFEAFGEVEGTGLYPFNANAILNILQKVDPSSATTFNPRTLIRDVLRPWLGDKIIEFDRGHFPSQSFLESLGGSTLGSADRTRLPDLTHGQLAILEFWGAPGEITTVEPVVYEAFGQLVPQLGRSTKPKGPVDPPPVPPPPDPLEADFRALEAWGRGEKVAAEVAQSARDAAYDAVVAFIDWDALGIEQRFAAGTTAPSLFRPKSVTLRGQETRALATPVQLELPLVDGDQGHRDTVLALQALLELRRRGQIASSNGLMRASKLRVALREWSDEVVRQVRALTTSHDLGLADAALALLATQAAMCGAVVRAGDRVSPEAIVLGPMPSTSTASSAGWRSAYAAIASRRGLLVDIVRSFMSGTKGGQRGRFVDTTRILASYWAHALSWDLGPLMEAEFSHTEAGKEVASALRAVSRSLDAGRSEELAATRAWLASVSVLGTDATTADAALHETETMLAQALGVPIFVPQPLQTEFGVTKASFVPAVYERAIKQAKRSLAVEATSGSLPLIVDEELLPARLAALAFLRAADRLAQQLEAAIDTREEAMGNLQRQVKSDRERIDQALDHLPSLLDALRGSADA